MDQLGVATQLAAGLLDQVRQRAAVLLAEPAAGEQQIGREAGPLLVGRRGAELGQHVVHMATEVLVGHVAAAVADQLPARGSSPRAYRSKKAGSTIRLARSPVAP